MPISQQFFLILFDQVSDHAHFSREPGIANHRYGVRCGRTVISTGQQVAREVKT